MTRSYPLSLAEVGLLLPTYQRLGNLEKILSASYKGGIRRFFIFIDGTSQAISSELESDQQDIISLISNWNKRNEKASIFYATSSLNLGCSSSILNGLDWISASVPYFLVLEDDCLPSSDFFSYSMDCFRFLDSDPRLMLFCGSQFAPSEITKGHPFKSRFSHTWGWGTSSKNWNKIRSMIIQDSKHKRSFPGLSVAESAYWKAGARRAVLGFTDVWDTLLSVLLLQHDLRAILPGENLVSNVGDDLLATHTFDPSPLHHLEIGGYKPVCNLEENRNADLWITKNVYGIRLRHLFSTQVSKLLDFSGLRRKKRPDLLTRWLKVGDLIHYA